MHNFDIIIAGGGPSGSATALQLCNLDPDLAGRILLLDKAVFPRAKLCAGGVSADAEMVLQQLGVNWDLPSVPIHETRFVCSTGCLTYQQHDQFRIIRREQFDHMLFKAACDRGVVARDGEPVVDVIRTQDEVIVRTSRNEYRTKIVVAADGANSTVRGTQGLSRVGRLMVGMELHVPHVAATIPNFDDNMVIIDLSVLAYGLPGYCWVFPTVSEGTISLGVLSAPFDRGEETRLKTIFAQWVGKLGVNLADFDVKSHPALRYEPRSPCALPRVLFVGDAAGVDPLFGEGITSALALGVIAAQAAIDALRTKEFSFSDYEVRIRSSAIGSMMRRRRMIARRLYFRPRLAQLYLWHGAILRGIALLRAPKDSKVTWEGVARIKSN